MKSHVFLVAALCCSCHPGMSDVRPKNQMQRQMVGLVAKFDRWDYDGDGQLNKKELSNGINSLKGIPQQVNYTSTEVLEFYDTDKSGSVSLAEAQDGYRRTSEGGVALGS